MGRLDGKVAVITGGARGQGAEEGRLFAAEGATVILTDVLDDEGKRTAAGLERTHYLHLDVRSEQEWGATIDGILARHGRVDVLINNAGIDLAKRFELTTLEDWDRVVAINQTGVFLGMRTVAWRCSPPRKAADREHLVGGRHGRREGRGAYGSTKWAVRGITKIGALEWGDRGIRVNSIHPGIIETPMTAGLRAFTDADVRARTERNIPLGRVGQAIDIAYMALFLASDESAYCTGQEFVVDGGVHH
jgi:3alpha(or 20beta)-hydroxysteroid dehydrogenase